MTSLTIWSLDENAWGLKSTLRLNNLNSSFILEIEVKELQVKDEKDKFNALQSTMVH